MIKQQYFFPVFIALSILLIVSFIISLTQGAVVIRITSLFQQITYQFGITQSSTLDNQQLYILNYIRLPRSLLTILIGAALALSGAAIQGLFRNPLAEPGLIGVASGAAIGATASILLSGFLLGQHWYLLHLFSLPVLAFIGSTLTTFIVLRMAQSPNGTSVVTMLLAGIAANALAGAIIGLFNYVADDVQLRSMTFWLMGSLSGASWRIDFIISLLLLSLVIILLPRYAKALNILLLGDSEARHLGVQVEKIKRNTIILTALAVGIAVAMSGIIGFLGLVVPHIIRLLFGPDHRMLLPMSACLGAILLLWADILARTVIAPVEIPIGIVTALLGAPFFFYLIIKQKRALSS